MPKKIEQHDLAIKNILLVLLLIVIFYILYSLQAIIIPLVMALLFAIMFQPLITWLRKVKMPRWLILPTVIFITLVVLLLLYVVVLETSSDLIDNKAYLLKRLQIKSNDFIQFLRTLPFIKIDRRMDWRGLFEILTQNKMGSTLSYLSNVLFSFSTSFFMFLLYYIVLLIGMADYKKYLNYVSGENEHSDLLVNYERIQRSIYSYMILKSFICLCTGFITYTVCLFYGINFAFFWGFITFLLTFIPTIGPIMAAIPPILMAAIQYDSLSPVSTLAIILIALKLIMGNVVEPLVMGGKLRLNLLTVLFGLVFWGFIWGIAGLILSVPLMVLIKLIFEQIPSLAIVSRIMGSSE